MGKTLGARVLLGIPTLSTARRSTRWIEAMASLQMPLGSSLGRVWVEDQTIAAARNALCERALAEGADYLVMLGDDVLPPPNMLLQMLDRIEREYPAGGGQLAPAHMITGVYWTKTTPPEPYLWQGLLKGSFRDWRAGDFFPVDMAGCDALMVTTEALRAMPRPWFSTDWVWEPGQKPSSIATEDFYFFSRAREQGIRLFADTGIQCLHEDRGTCVLYGLSEDMPQATGAPAVADGHILVAELGSGADVPFHGANAVVMTFDGRLEARPDVVCDLAAIPEHYEGLFDLVHARHVLEHFSRAQAGPLVRRWARLLKPGGQLVIRVPNLAFAMRTILRAAEEPGTVAPDLQVYAWAQLYGGQGYPLDFHRNGFVAGSLHKLLAGVPGMTDVTAVEENDGLNLCVTGTLTAVEEPPALSEMWERITAREAMPAGAALLPEPVRDTRPAAGVWRCADCNAHYAQRPGAADQPCPRCETGALARLKPALFAPTPRPRPNTRGDLKLDLDCADPAFDATVAAVFGAAAQVAPAPEQVAALTAFVDGVERAGFGAAAAAVATLPAAPFDVVVEGEPWPRDGSGVFLRAMVQGAVAATETARRARLSADWERTHRPVRVVATQDEARV